MFFGKQKSYIFFFHNTDHYHEVFNSKSRLAHRDPKDPRPTFYWFSDRFHSHLGSPDKYIYLFVKNPKKDNIHFRPRHLEPTFDAIYRDYLEFLSDRERPAKERKSQGFCEPPVLMSFSDIEPDLIALYNENENTHSIIKPKKYTGLAFRLFNEKGVPMPFNQIDNIVEILPRIKKSIPFMQPIKVKGEYVFEDFSLY